MIPIQVCKRILQTNNNKRISLDASKELSEQLEEIGYTITEQANKYATHAGRKTIRQEDVLLAVETLEQ